MGAELIGYQTMFPTEFTKEEKEKLNKHLDVLEKLLKTPNLAKLIVNEEDADGKYLSQLNNLCPSIPYEMNDQGWCYEDFAEDINELISEVLDSILTAKKFITKPEIDEIDVSGRIYTILGRNYMSVFAGEATWGDEPEGGGYTLLKDLDKLNLLTLIEELTIPQSQAVHFITEENKDES